MPLPPGPSSFPQIHTSGERRLFLVSNRSGTTMSSLGPFQSTWIPFSGAVQIMREGQMVDVEARVLLPHGTKCRPRSILTEITSNTSYEVYDVKVWADHVEAFVARSSGDQ